MSYVNTDNRKQIKFVLTNTGKREGFKHGLLNIFKYYTIMDSGVDYTVSVEPDKFNDLNGLHTTSTNIPTCTNGTEINKNI